MDKLAAIVITYYPHVEETIANIKQFIDGVEHLIIWENTPLEDRSRYTISLPEYAHKISYQSTGKNEGIAYPLNQCIRWAKENDCTGILSMDQDSFWVNFQEHLTSVAAYFQNNPPCIATPNINRHFYSPSNEPKAIHTAIISGALWPIAVIDKVGSFDETLFVDAVDEDYSLRINRKGFKILLFPDSVMNQKYGYTYKSKIPGLASANYSAARTYYIVKNHIILYRHYKKELTKKEKSYIFRTYTVYRFIKIILIENDKLKKLSAIIRGVIDGIRQPYE